MSPSSTFAALTLALAAALVLGAFARTAPGLTPVTARVAAPAINALSQPELAPSGRLIVTGTGFGAAGPGSALVIDGLAAFTTQWSDTRIVGYVPEAVSLGSVAVEVSTSMGQSNGVQLQIVPRQQVGRVRWRFAVDADFVENRQGIAPDGTVYVNDVKGRLYALTPDGGLKWIVDALRGQAGHGSAGPVVVDADGTIYVAVDPLGPAVELVAFAPDASLRWAFTDPGARSIAAGPTIGPDGSVYLVIEDPDQIAFGVTALTSQGALIWNTLGNPVIWEESAVGAEIVFGASQPGGRVDQLVVTGDRGGGARYVYAFALATGAQHFAVPAGGLDSNGMQFQLQPAIGVDGTVLLTEFVAAGPGWGLQAFDGTSGARTWRYSPGINAQVGAPDVARNGTIYFSWDISRVGAVSAQGDQVWTTVYGGLVRGGPTVSPDDRILLIGGGPSGQPGRFIAFDAHAGSVLWEVQLPAENGNVVPNARAIFTVDASTAYFPASIANNPPSDVYCYLYALDTAEQPTSFCFGAGSEAACPCANGGAAGRGCENSAGTGGALLSKTGVASLSADTAVLTSSGQLATVLCIVIQGDSAIPPASFGDGLRCVGGNLKRLHVENAVDGVIVYPDGGETVLHTQSANLGDPIPLGATRNYQVYYRDPSASFCPDPPGGTFNVSNAVAIEWGA